MFLYRRKKIKVTSPVWIDRKTQSKILMKRNWVPVWIWRALGFLVVLNPFRKVLGQLIDSDEWESVLRWVSDEGLGRLSWESRNAHYHRWSFPWIRASFTLSKERPVAYFPRWPKDNIDG